MLRLGLVQGPQRSQADRRGKGIGKRDDLHLRLQSVERNSARAVISAVSPKKIEVVVESFTSRCRKRDRRCGQALEK